MHRCVDVYGLGVEWAMSGRGGGGGEVEKGQDDATAVLAYSAVLWSGHLSDSFTSGRLNRHLLMLRVKEVMGRLKAVDGLVEEEERRRLQSLFEQWQPRTRKPEAAQRHAAARVRFNLQPTNALSFVPACDVVDRDTRYKIGSGVWRGSWEHSAR